MYLGIDIGGTKCAVVRGNENGEIFEKEVIKTTSVDETLSWILSTAEKLKMHSKAVGISCGGPLDADKGVVLSPPNLPGWDNIEIVKLLEERLKIPAFLCNDANACALAEWKFGVGKGSRNMIFLTFGTGLGAGIILDGKLYNGANGMAGEVGHIRLNKFGPVGFGKQGSFEGFCSGGGIAQLGKTYAIEQFQKGIKVSFCEDYSALDNVTAKYIAECAYNGNQDAIGIFDLCGEMLGYGLSILVDILNPERIVLGSIFQRCESLLRPSMERVLNKECLTQSLNCVSILPAKLGDSIGDCAALAVAVVNCVE